MEVRERNSQQSATDLNTPLRTFLTGRYSSASRGDKQTDPVDSNHREMAQPLFQLIWRVYYVAIRTRQYFLSSFGIDLANAIPAIVSLISLYFTLLSLYRTTRFTLRFIYLFSKWAILFWVVASSIGFAMSGGKVFGLAPVLEVAIARGLERFGWDNVPDVAVDRDGIRVNGIKAELPLDYHQYGNTWQKFKSKTNKKTKHKSRSIFDRFDASTSDILGFTSSKSKEQKRGSSSKSERRRTSQSGAGGSASIAQRVLGNALDLDVGELWQSVEAIQEEVKQTFGAVVEALGNPSEDEINARDGQEPWW